MESSRDASKHDSSANRGQKSATSNREPRSGPSTETSSTSRSSSRSNEESFALAAWKNSEGPPPGSRLGSPVSPPRSRQVSPAESQVRSLDRPRSRSKASRSATQSGSEDCSSGSNSSGSNERILAILRQTAGPDAHHFDTCFLIPFGARDNPTIWSAAYNSSGAVVLPNIGHSIRTLPHLEARLMTRYPDVRRIYAVFDIRSALDSKDLLKDAGDCLELLLRFPRDYEYALTCTNENGANDDDDELQIARCFLLKMFLDLAEEKGLVATVYHGGEDWGEEDRLEIVSFADKDATVQT